MKRLNLKLIVLGGLIITFFISPYVFAATPQTTGEIYGVIWKIVDWFFAFIIVISVIFILVSAYFFISAQGDEKNIQKAKTILWYSIIGLIVAILAISIVNIIQNFLGAPVTTHP